MHYINIWRNTKLVLVFLLVVSIRLTLSAQNTTSPTSIPQGKVDPSQVSSQQAVEFYNKAKAAGMTDMDIERAAMQRGYTLDDIATMRNKLGQTMDSSDPNNKSLKELEEAREKFDSTRQSDSLGTTATNASYRNRAFGASFFQQSASSFEPNLRLATPKNYILGPEDELVVDIFGNAVDNFRLKISPEGTVKMLNLAPVHVSGLTVEQASQKIVSRLRQAYSSLDRPGSGTYSSTTLGNIRSIKVMITGEVYKPGTYTVSSLSTAFNAIYLSGGPNPNGSFRNIEIIRDNKTIRVIDLYRFLVDADLNDNIALRDQDIILVRPYTKRIEINGEVKRNGIFESKGKETILDMIRYAGGFQPEAYSSRITYQRNTGSNYIIGSLDSTEINTFIPANGDKYYVDKILDIVANEIIINGAVTKPGSYPLEDRSNTLLELIDIAQGISPRAFLNRAIINRFGSVDQTGVIAIDLGKIIRKEEDDIQLLPGDVVTILSIEDLKENYSISVNGEVNNPGQQSFQNHLTIADVIFKAGGFKEGGLPYRIEVSRRIRKDSLSIPQNQNVIIYTLNVSEDLQIEDQDQRFELEPFDIISIRKSHRYEVQKRVTVLGEVYYPGSYTILNNFELISDLFPKVGGLKPGAYLAGARFYRAGRLIALNIEAIVKNPSISANLLLKNGDTLYIPTKPQIVSIQGAVLNPSLINFDPSFSFKNYISQAGGYTEQALKKRIFVTNPNGRTQRTNNFLFFKSYPKVVPGSLISVPIKEKKPQREFSAGERIALFSLISTLSLAVISLLR